MNPQLWSWLLTAVGVTGLYFAGKKKAWAWFIGLGAQVLWFSYAIVTEQYGFIVSSFAYGWVYLKNGMSWTNTCYPWAHDWYRRPMNTSLMEPGVQGVVKTCSKCKKEEVKVWVG